MSIHLAAGRVALSSPHDAPVRGDVDTDLDPGVYLLRPDLGRKLWVFEPNQVKTGLRFSVGLDNVAHPFELRFPERFLLLAHEGFLSSGERTFEAAKAGVADAVGNGRFADAFDILDALDDIGLYDVADELWLDKASVVLELLRHFRDGVAAKSYDMMRILRVLETFYVESRSRLHVDSFMDAYVHPSSFAPDKARADAGLTNVKIAFTYNLVPQRAIIVYADDITKGTKEDPEPLRYGPGELLYPAWLNAVTTPRMHAAKRRLLEQIESQNLAFFVKAWQAVDLVIFLVLAAHTLTGATTSAVEAAMRTAAPISDALAAEREMGRWLPDFEAGLNMSEADAAYQMRAGNAPGSGVGFYRGSVQYDGRELATRTLIEVKNWQDGGRMTGALARGEYWAGMRVLRQGMRQVGAAGGYRVQWRVAGRAAADVIQKIFRANKLPIDVVFFP
jgi:hypothetical protein